MGFRKSAEKVENSKAGLDKQQLDAIKWHFELSREEHEETRTLSIKQKKSIIAAIVDSVNPNLSPHMSDTQHTQALKYYSDLLSIHDREQLVNILCRQHPDLLTQAIREVVAAYDPIIRSIHNGVDLGDGLTDMQTFLNDLIKTSQPKSSRAKNLEDFPSVQDYIDLLHKHVPSSLHFLHLVAKNCPDVREAFRKYAKKAISAFRQPRSSDKSTLSDSGNGEAAGSMTSALQAMFSELNPAEKGPIMAALDTHAAYLASLRAASLQNPTRNAALYGCVLYVARWNALLDETLLTPSTVDGPVRRGKDLRNTSINEQSNFSKEDVTGNDISQQRRVMVEMSNRLDVSVVRKAFGPKFTALLKAMESRTDEK